VTLLLAITGSFLYATRTDARAMRNAADMARVDAVARAAVMRALIDSLKPTTQPGVWRRGAQAQEWSFDGLKATVSLVDESARIDLNTGNDALLSGVLRRAGLEESEAARLLDAILDWRDADGLRRPNGAEAPDYDSAGLAGRPANQLFQSVEELQLVLGMRAETYQRLTHMITVYSRQPGVNPHYASRETLLAIPAVTEGVVDEYLAQRDAAVIENRPPPPFAAAGAFAAYSRSAAVTVRVDVATADGLTVSREAVAIPTPQFPKRPFAVLAWRELPRRSLPGDQPSAVAVSEGSAGAR
jgi:general secretion pathway protein K